MASESPGTTNRRDAHAPGAVIADRYRLDRLIGEGGMGSVWAGHHMVTHRAVALKFLKCAGESPESRARFLREARVACAVMHPNVVEVLDFVDSSSEPPTMVLELLAGESLGKLLARSGRLSLSQTADILAPVVSAVGSAHAEGIVHRDLKPDNIFLQRERDGSFVVKVLDFGVAKLTVVDDDARTDVGLTHSGAILGTPSYMSPEQVFGEVDLDHRADIWALGIILYQCLTGVLPTEAGNTGQVFKIIVAGTIKGIREVAPDVPEDLALLIDSMLARKREARPADLRPVLTALQRHSQRSAPPFGPPRTARGSGSPGRGTGSSAPAFAPRHVEQDSHGTDALTGDGKRDEAGLEREVLRDHHTEARAPSRTRRWPVVAAWAAGLVCVGFLGAMLVAKRREPEAPRGLVVVSDASSVARPVASLPTPDPALPTASAAPPERAVASVSARPPEPSATAGAATAPKRGGAGKSLSGRAPAGSSPAGPPPGPATHPEDPYGF